MTAKVKAPKVVRQWAQPVTGGAIPTILPAPQEIGFFGHQGEEHKSFKVLAGEGSPTLTGGWVKLAKVQRFQRVSITVPEGYDPLTITIPVLFDAVVAKEVQEDIETDILKLEWMAGRTAHPTTEIVGEPPYVEVYSLSPSGTQTNLVPKQFQTVPGISQQWYITQLTYDANPLRATDGNRVRQLATIELTEIVLSPTALGRVRKQREASKNKFVTYTTNTQINTIRKVAAAKGVPGAWKAILQANKNLGNNADKHLKRHTKVKVPLTALTQVPR